MGDLILSQNESLTMSSREIAELTGKLPKTVMRDIRDMFEQLGEGTDLYLTHYTVNNRQYTEYRLPKRECMILVSGYNVGLRAKIVDRWLELEEGRMQMVIPAARPEVIQIGSDIKSLMIMLNVDAVTTRAMLPPTIDPEVNAVMGLLNVDQRVAITMLPHRVDLMPQQPEHEESPQIKRIKAFLATHVVFGEGHRVHTKDLHAKYEKVMEDKIKQYVLTTIINRMTDNEKKLMSIRGEVRQGFEGMGLR